ncbi:hypothetical protein ASG36_01365 [Geodermatophilus sp. Leaf369]|nr:hypothetical protein ASG36_01365 [Geodermatophilus sp. Leaf369]
MVLWAARRAAGHDAPPPAWRGDDGALRAAVAHHRAWLLLAAHGPDVPGVPGALLAEARARRDRARRAQLQTDADLTVAGAALDAAGVRWACLKGPVLTAVHARAGADRAALDLDLLVAPDRLAAALDALEGAGGALLTRNFALLRRELPGEVAVRGRFGTVLDLHWTLVNRAGRRRRTTVSTADLLDRASPVQLAGRPVPALQPDDALVHVCLHAALAGATRVSWLLDVTLSVQDRPVDWSRVVGTARAWGVPAPVGLVLARAATLLAAPVPRSVLRRLAAPDWRLAERWAGPRVLHSTADLGSWPARLAVGSAEHATVPGLLTARAARLVAGRPAAFVQGASAPGSALHPAGDHADLTAFLQTVAQEAA